MRKMMVTAIRDDDGTVHEFVMITLDVCGASLGSLAVVSFSVRVKLSSPSKQQFAVYSWLYHPLSAMHEAPISCNAALAH